MADPEVVQRHVEDAVQHARAPLAARNEPEKEDQEQQHQRLDHRDT
jgi:hypothetical protein